MIYMGIQYLMKPLRTLYSSCTIRRRISGTMIVSAKGNKRLAQSATPFLARRSRPLSVAALAKQLPLERSERAVSHLAREHIARIEWSEHFPGYDDSFFIADLGRIQYQHALWRAYLPSIQPFYGKPFSTACSWLKLIDMSTSRQVQPGSNTSPMPS